MTLKGVTRRPSAVISVVDHKNYKDRFGLLGKGLLTAGDTKECYRVGKFTNYVNVYINITNDSNNTIDVRMWVSHDTEPKLEDLVEASIVIESGLTYVRGPIVLSQGERIFLLTSGDQCIYRLYGADMRSLSNM